jgi:hypothetical protein
MVVVASTSVLHPAITVNKKASILQGGFARGKVPFEYRLNCMSNFSHPSSTLVTGLSIVCRISGLEGIEQPVLSRVRRNGQSLP